MKHYIINNKSLIKSGIQHLQYHWLRQPNYQYVTFNYLNKNTDMKVEQKKYSKSSILLKADIVKENQIYLT